MYQALNIGIKFRENDDSNIDKNIQIGEKVDDYIQKREDLITAMDNDNQQ